MACFLACFGCTKKRKRPKCCTKIISSNQVHGKYVPLDSQLPQTQNFKNSGSEKQEKTKEQSSLKVKKKKVSFNLDVKTYEPLTYDDESDDVDCSEGEEETKWEFNAEETKRAMVGWHHQKHVPTNFRYQNIQDFYDEEDEIMVEDSDLDDDIFDDEEWSDDLDNEGDEDDGKIINDSQASEEDSNHNVGHRGRYGCSVLNPVENLTQWKSIKANDNLQRKRQKGCIISEQENKVPDFGHSKLLQHEIAVNASLANWLLTSKEEQSTKV